MSDVQRWVFVSGPDASPGMREWPVDVGSQHITLSKPYVLASDYDALKERKMSNPRDEVLAEMHDFTSPLPMPDVGVLTTPNVLVRRISETRLLIEVSQKGGGKAMLSIRPDQEFVLVRHERSGEWVPKLKP